ncbi:MAG: trypsin-like peptidase domain-containing protein [Gemmatimonadota bacterium]|nr:MAG: trypsin-like peptidase domain-containing protein [Gemmatimonadota bacterium]
MRRNRDWMKLGALVAIAAILVIGFTSMVDLPRDSMAQPVVPRPVLTSQPKQQPAIPEARPLAELGNAFTAVAEAARPAVVFIEVEKRTEQSSRSLPSPFERLFPQAPEPRIQQGTGSGFIVSSDGYILTNNHVVEGADRVDVRLPDDREFEAEVVGGDPLTDVAVIKIDASGLTAIPLGDSDSVSVGQWVLAIGNPLGDAFTFTVTAGIVSARGRLLRGLQTSTWDIQDFIQTDAAINRGNSGGPLVNIRGEVVGINSAIASETGFYNGYGFAIPINLAQQVAEQLISEGRVVRAALGVSIVAVDQEAADYVGLDEIRGVVIASFPEGDSPARRAGLRERDVIVEVAGEKIEYGAQLQTIVGFKQPGETIDVTVMRRGGDRRTYSVRLKEAETDASQTVASRPREDSDRPGSLVTRLGISIEEFGEDDARRMRLSPGQVEYGLLVTGVDRDGPARGKVFAGSANEGFIEVITHVDDTEVRTRRDLNAALAGVPAGDVVSLRVVQITGGQPQARFVFVRTTGNRQ